eukprot:6193027-Pleurochrysis_carterae.AAC.1
MALRRVQPRLDDLGKFGDVQVMNDIIAHAGKCEVACCMTIYILTLCGGLELSRSVGGACGSTDQDSNARIRILWQPLLRRTILIMIQ